MPEQAPLSDAALDQVFGNGRTFKAWRDAPVPEDLLHRLYDLWKLGPTSANCSPARVIFVKSAAAKERLKPCLSPGNLEAVMAAPVTAIVGYDTQFYEWLPELFPQTDARAWFAGNPPLIEETAFRNSSMQAGYMILAARALGLDCGPMSGFDRARTDAEFFPDGRVKSNMLVSIGYGDRGSLGPRGPRLAFDEACVIE
ncbi:malonic semialdehyde reductase [Caenispirillum salinarum]|uniref:malonic semialdehyde reductase n=1 Tax=Caenispirillum salinarum TaxID=859058 RepID=UPI00384F7989